jgi:hypothetical protein
MDDQERLAMIKANMEASRRNLRPPYIGENDADWLVSQVEGLGEDRTRLKAYFDHVEAERDRYRELLGRLEWAGNVVGTRCPVCRAIPYPERGLAHYPGCELAEALGRE